MDNLPAANSMVVGLQGNQLNLPHQIAVHSEAEILTLQSKVAKGAGGVLPVEAAAKGGRWVLAEKFRSDSWLPTFARRGGLTWMLCLWNRWSYYSIHIHYFAHVVNSTYKVARQFSLQRCRASLASGMPKTGSLEPTHQCYALYMPKEQVRLQTWFHFFHRQHVLGHSGLARNLTAPYK